MPSPLISASDLRQQIAVGDVVVVDCRWYLGEPDAGRAAYDDGHIPGAVYASLDTVLSSHEGAGRHPLPSPQAFADAMEALGISNDCSVVAYDDRGGAVAARLWWMLNTQGLDDVTVLDGGVQAWTQSGGTLDQVEPTTPQGSFAPTPWTGVVDIDAVASRPASTTVIDARSADRYRGETEPVDPKAGHIPGAVSLPLTGNLNEDLTFLTPTELRTRFTHAGLVAGESVISQCGSGVTACHNILAMDVAGMGRPALYVGSWSDWSNSERPVATGDRP